MADKIDFFWEIFEAVSGSTGEGVTDALNSLAKSDRAKVETYFSDVIDQSVFGTEDYNRLRKFLVDLFATHRTLISQSIASSDPHAMSNSDLDELFRSFGYPHSPQLRGSDENPLEQKVQFFLDLVNLYKVKGTPQSLVDILQYYGVTEVDIYEFILKLSSPGNLIFNGKAVAGTSVDPNVIKILYDNMTADDPHWLYTSQQILQLNETNKINLPSQSPYLGVQPIVDLEGIEFSIISRTIQDQYNLWSSGGTLPLNADISYIGEVRSLLELYLSAVYMFNNQFDAGLSQDPCNFLCYDGTSTIAADIVDSFDTLTSPPIRRCDLNSNIPPFTYDSTSGLYIPSSYCANSKLAQYYDEFTRASSTNFLVDKTTAGTVLDSINSSLKNELDNASDPVDVLGTLLYDLANWVRTNIGFGFVNFAFILFGLKEFFSNLVDVINFFKPYRARLLLIEALQIRNRLFNSIVIEDDISTDVNLEVYDYMTGNSIACCTSDSTTLPVCTGDEITQCHRKLAITPPSSTNMRGIWGDGNDYLINDITITGSSPGDQYICIQAHTATTATKPGVGSQWTLFWVLYSQMVCTDTTGVNASVYSRETFDCGSYFDIGAVTDISRDVFIQYEEEIHDQLRCPRDSSAAVVSEILDVEYYSFNTTHMEVGVSSDSIAFTDLQPNVNYSIGATLRNEGSPISIYSFIVTEKTTAGFTLTFSGIIDSSDYYVDWYVTDSTNAMMTELIENEQTHTIPLHTFCQDSTDYSIAATLRNDTDATASIYAWTIVEKTTTSFTVRFSGPLDSSNYVFEWFICEGNVEGNYNVSSGVSQVTVPIPASVGFDTYPLLVAVGSDDLNSSVYAPIISEKTESNFTVQFSGVIDTTGNYFVSWVIPNAESIVSDFEFYQTGGFRDFDDEGRFDCTHGFDYVHVSVEDVTEYMLQENNDYLLQEDDSRILL
jgi:hypothetical protein